MAVSAHFRRFEERSVGRRAEDRLTIEKIRQHNQLFRVGQIITSEMNLELLFETIIEQTNQIMETERSTVFLYDREKDLLWSLVATGLGKNKIRIPADHGVAGWVFRNNAPLTINDAYQDSRFCSDVDQNTGFRTRNILCIPLKNREGRCIGVLEAMNKISGNFTPGDNELLASISHYVAIALENARLYEKVKNYSEELKYKLTHIETLEKIKNQLTKFVPSSVARLVEDDPDKVTLEKRPSDVSILFLDIQNFSSITEGFGQELVNDMVECHFSRYLECINRHGGEVNETSGDGLMVIFKDSSPEAHARNAVAAGLEIIAENRRLNDKLSYPWGDVQLHLGINTGEAWVGSTKMKSLTGERWTYTASGLVTVLAARIGALSTGTKLYAGPETYEFVRGWCDVESLGPRKLKNVKNPFPIYWIKGIRNSLGRREKLPSGPLKTNRSGTGTTGGKGYLKDIREKLPGSGNRGQVLPAQGN